MKRPLIVYSLSGLFIIKVKRKTLEKSSIKRYYSNDSLFILKEFLNAKNLQTLQGVNQNSSDETGSNNDLLVRE